MRGLASLLGGFLAQKAAENLEPGALRGTAFGVSGGLSLLASFNFTVATVGSFAFALTTAETGVGAAGGIILGTFSAGLAISEAQTAATRFNQAAADFGIDLP